MTLCVCVILGPFSIVIHLAAVCLFVRFKNPNFTRLTYPVIYNYDFVPIQLQTLNLKYND